MLLREVHHRVKNNLQVIVSLLDLQAETVEDPHARAILEDCQHRVHVIAFIHESLQQAEAPATLDAAQYLRQLCQHLFEACHPAGEQITLTLMLEPVQLTVATAISCGLILNEWLTNACKHAFPEDCPGAITIELHEAPPETGVLRVRDSGIGMPVGLDLYRSESLGLHLVGLLAEYLRGTITLERECGTTWTLTFPLNLKPATGERHTPGA